jgi:hypothetical protein
MVLLITESKLVMRKLRLTVKLEAHSHPRSCSSWRVLESKLKLVVRTFFSQPLVVRPINPVSSNWRIKGFMGLHRRRVRVKLQGPSLSVKLCQFQLLYYSTTVLARVGVEPHCQQSTQLTSRGKDDIGSCEWLGRGGQRYYTQRLANLR